MKKRIFDIENFQECNQILIPEDLRIYLERHSNMLDKCNDKLFEFYSLGNIKRVSEGLVFKTGSPDYSNIINTLKNHNDCFVFADYMFGMFSYGICLYKEKVSKNEIYVICGDQYKIIANSFTDFLALYNKDAFELTF